MTTTMKCMLAAAMAVLPLASCTGSKGGGKKPEALRILCGTFPIWQFTRNVTAGRQGVTVELMLPATAGCPHDHALSVSDLRKIAAADVLVLNGLGVEGPIDDAARKANPKLTVIDSSKAVPPNDTWFSARQHESVQNPHLFASPRQAARLVLTLGEELAKADPAGAELYRRNAKAYGAKLDALADEFAAAAKEFRSTHIVTEHNVFDYLARDAGLTVVAVIDESGGVPPSAGHMAAVVQTIRRSGAAAVFTEPQYSAKAAKTIAAEAGVPVESLDPVAGGPENAPLDYYETTMRRNLATLKRVLGR